jgi:hypothetical protein
LGWLFVILSRTSGFQPEYAFPLPAAAAGIALAVLAASLAALGPARRMGQFEGLQEI